MRDPIRDPILERSHSLIKDVTSMVNFNITYLNKVTLLKNWHVDVPDAG